MTSYQMMYGINLFSTLFTLWSLIQVRVTSALNTED